LYLIDEFNATVRYGTGLTLFTCGISDLAMRCVMAAGPSRLAMRFVLAVGPSRMVARHWRQSTANILREEEIRCVDGVSRMLRQICLYSSIRIKETVFKVIRKAGVLACANPRLNTNGDSPETGCLLGAGNYFSPRLSRGVKLNSNPGCFRMSCLCEVLRG